MLIEKAQIEDADLPLDAFKAHLRQGTGFGNDTLQDAVLTGFLRAAISAIETRIGKVLMQRIFEWRIGAGAAGDAIPLNPVQAITAILVFDRYGNEQSVDVADYWIDQDAYTARLGRSLPRVPAGGAIQLGLRVGMVETFAALPADLTQAIMMLAAHYYEYRNDTSLSQGCMPFGVTSLIERYRTLRLSGAAS